MTRERKPPASKVRMSDIAELAGVSEATVSRALGDSPNVNERTRAHIQKIAAERGYRINPLARGLRVRRTGIVSVAVPLAHDREQRLSDPFLMTLLAHLADEFSERGYSILLNRISKRQAGWIDQLYSHGPADAIVVVGQSLEHDAIQAAEAANIPLIVWGTQLPDQKYTSVGSDNREGGQLATRHLIEMGRRKIAFVGDERLPEIRERYEGYVQTLSDANVMRDPRLHIRSSFLAEDARAAIRAMIAKGASFDGLFAASDVIALSAVRALAEARRAVPRDVSVIGFDDIPMARHSNPSLTTVRQNVAVGASRIAELALARIAGRTTDSVRLPPELVIRESA